MNRLVLARAGPTRFAIGVTVRAALLGGLVFAAALAVTRELYATVVVLAVLALILVIDLIRSASSADRVLAHFVEGMTSEGYDRPAPQPGLGHVAAAIDAALDRLARVRADRQRRIDHLESMLDNVAAALLVVDDRGQVLSANRAARHGLGAEPGALAAAPGLTPEIVQRLMALPPGARDIVRLADGRAMLVQVALFTADARALRLVSLQSVSGDLDAVELKAWQDLVRVLAHEMMNSLTPVSSLSESLAARLRRGEADVAETADAVEVIARRSSGLMSFIDRYRRLTDLPRAEKVRLPAGELVHALDGLMAPMMREAGVDYASRIEPKSLVLTADPDLLEQALINLLKNALEAVRGRDGAAVRFAIRVEDAQVALIVEDNGPGLPEGDPESPFVPFFTTKAGGSGVGLTLARQIAIAHAGRLEHTARPAGGAIFKLSLPLG